MSVGGAKTDAHFAQALWLEQSTHPSSFLSTPHKHSRVDEVPAHSVVWHTEHFLNLLKLHPLILLEPKIRVAGF